MFPMWNRCEGRVQRMSEGMSQLNLCEGRVHRMFEGMPKNLC